MSYRPRICYQCGQTGHIVSAHREGRLGQGNVYVASARNVYTAPVFYRGGGRRGHGGNRQNPYDRNPGGRNGAMSESTPPPRTPIAARPAQKLLLEGGSGGNTSNDSTAKGATTPSRRVDGSSNQPRNGPTGQMEEVEGVGGVGAKDQATGAGASREYVASLEAELAAARAKIAEMEATSTPLPEGSTDELMDYGIESDIEL